MNIKITIGAFEVCTFDDALNNFKINGQRISEAVELPRADAISVLDRKNVRTTISFDVTRLHDTIEEAIEFLLMHNVGLNEAGAIGRFTITSRDENGAETERFLDSAIVESNAGSHNGITSFFSYNVVGGLLKNSV